MLPPLNGMNAGSHAEACISEWLAAAVNIAKLPDSCGKSSGRPAT